MTPALVPEFLVSDLKISLAFWCDLLGFAVLYERPEERFAYLRLGRADVMLEQQTSVGRFWVTGDLATPFGRGINIQIEVETIEPIVQRLSLAQWPLYLPPEDKWYRRQAVEVGNRQFLVQDPDGYLLRPFQSLGERPSPSA